MGFMGLNHWGESDNASGFVYTLEETLAKTAKEPLAEQKRMIRLKVNEELRNEANEYNTPGAINIALVVEAERDEELRAPALKLQQGDWNINTPHVSDMLTVDILRRCREKLIRYKLNWEEEAHRIQQLIQVINKEINSRARRR